MQKWIEKLLKALSKLIKTTPAVEPTKPDDADEPGDVVTPPGPVTPPAAEKLRAVKIYETPRKLKIAGLEDTPRGLITCEYDTFSRKRTVLRLIGAVNSPLHDGKEETAQAPVISGDLLIFPTERHKNGLLVLDRLTLRKLKGIEPKHEICIAGGTWNERPIVASNPYPIGNAVIQDALSGAVIKTLSVKGCVTSIAGNMCTIRADGNGDNGLLNWQTGLFEPMKATVCTTWWGSLYVGTSDGRIIMINTTQNRRNEIAVGGPVYSLQPDVSRLWFTVANPNRLGSIDINGNAAVVAQGLAAKLGWFGLPVTVDAAGRVVWAEWDEKRELSIVWRMERA